MNGKILAVDPGDKRIGIAVSDPTQTIANPLMVIKHVARVVDAAQIAQIAADQDVVSIIVGCPYDLDGLSGPQARKSERMAEAIRSQTDLPVTLYDESGWRRRRPLRLRIRRTALQGSPRLGYAVGLLPGYLQRQ